MTNQGLDFLDIDLGLYVNSFENSSLDSSSCSSVNIFSSNPNLSILNEYNNKETALTSSSLVQKQINETLTIDVGLIAGENMAKTNKTSFNFYPQVHRTHSYSFSSSSCDSSAINHELTNSTNTTSYNKSSSQLFNNKKNNITNNETPTAKKAILKYLDKKISKKNETSKHIRIESKSMQPQVNSHIYSNIQHVNNTLVTQQSLPLSNSFSSMTSFGGSVSSSNISPSSNSSICSSSSSNLNSSIDYHNIRQFTDLKSHLQQTTASLHMDPLTTSVKFECDNDRKLKKQSTNEQEPIMDLYSSNNTPHNHFDDLNNLTTPTDSINQLDFVSTIIPAPQQQKKQPLLLPKPAPVTYNYSTSSLMPHVTQSPFISNSQISMMIPSMTNGIISRSNSQPDLTLSNLDPNFTTDMINSTYSSFNPNFGNSCMNQNQQIVSLDKNRPKVIRRHPSLSYKSSMSEFNEQDEAYMGNFFTNINMPNSSINGKTSPTLINGALTSNNGTDDGLFLGTDALSDFISNCGAITDLFEDIPDLEDLMSLVTFESSSSSSAALSSSVPATTMQYQQIKQTQCDLNLPDRTNSNINDCINTNPLSNYYDYCNTESSITNQNESNQDNETDERTTRSAPPSPTPQKKKQRPTGNTISFNKAWNKMNQEEQSKAVEYLTRIINVEMGLREQLEIIRILNPDAKLKPTDTQFIIDMKIIDDDKFKRIKDVIKTYGLFITEKQISDNSSDCSANSCPQSYQLAKRELRIKRAQQRMKLKQKKDQRQINKETKSGLFSKTEVIPLSLILPEEDIEVDILS